MPEKKAEHVSDDELCEALLRLSKNGKLRREELVALNADMLDARIAMLKLQEVEAHAHAQLIRLSLANYDDRPLINASGQGQTPPPRIVECFIWLVLPRKVRDAILGDAEEAYWQTIDRYGSRTAATVDYCKEAFFAILGTLRMSVSQLISAVFRHSS